MNPSITVIFMATVDMPRDSGRWGAAGALSLGLLQTFAVIRPTPCVVLHQTTHELWKKQLLICTHLLSYC